MIEVNDGASRKLSRFLFVFFSVEDILKGRTTES